MATVDAKGRVAIPADVRRRTGIDVGCEVDVSADGRAVRVVGVKARCALCDSTRGLVAFADGERHLCLGCIGRIAEKV